MSWAHPLVSAVIFFFLLPGHMTAKLGEGSVPSGPESPQSPRCLSPCAGQVLAEVTRTCGIVRAVRAVRAVFLSEVVTWISCSVPVW